MNENYDRRLKKETGMSFSEHLIRIRIKAADSIINNNPQASITEIATQVGFFDPYYFSKVFKKYKAVQKVLEPIYNGEY